MLHSLIYYPVMCLVVLQTGINSSVTPKTDEELLEQAMRFQDMIHRYGGLQLPVPAVMCSN